MNKFALTLTIAALSVAAFETPAAAQKTLTIYNVATKYMDWARLADAYDSKGLVRLTRDLKNGSGGALAAMKAEAANPQSNGVFWGPEFALDGKRVGLTAAYKPVGFDAIPDALKDPEGHWWTIATAYVVMGVNTDVLAKRNLKIPTSWNDLLKPEYKGLACSMDPTWSGTAAGFTYGINFILGGTKSDFTPGLTWVRAYHRNGQQFRTEVIAGRLPTGECPITIDAEGNILLEKLKGAPVEVVVPSEGVISIIAAMSMIKGAPMPEETKAFFNWLLTDEAQAIIARAYFRPIRREAVPSDVARVMPRVEKEFILDTHHQAEAINGLKRAFTDIVMRDADLAATLRREKLTN